MKAKIRKTGEIVNIAEYAKIALEQCDSWGNPIEMKPEDVELIEDITEDRYQQDVRERAAITAMQGALANCYLHSVSNCAPYSSIAKESVLYADALIEELKKK